MTENDKTLDLILRAFRVYNGFDGPNSDQVFWRTDGEYAPVTLIANCSDLFWWGTADAEDITVDNIDVLEGALADVQAASPELRRMWLASDLFCCRMRGMRPQKPYYKHISDSLKPLFDACGPERDE